MDEGLRIPIENLSTHRHKRRLFLAGTHADLQEVDFVDLDIYMQYPIDTKEVWQKAINGYLRQEGAPELIGKIRVFPHKIEDRIL